MLDRCLILSLLAVDIFPRRRRNALLRGSEISPRVSLFLAEPKAAGGGAERRASLHRVPFSSR